MKKLTIFKVQNNQGQDLLDNYIKSICKRINVNLQEAPDNSNRGTAVYLQNTSDLTLWDCSVEQGHVYNAFNMWVKTTQNNVIVSRTPLPRNVLTHFQCSPIHGEQFPNEVIGEWLDKQLPAILQGKYSDELYSSKTLARHYWMFEKPAKYFLSFRGTNQKDAETWQQHYEQAYQTSVRMVPPNEYSYPTECVTLQQMWEGAARLMHEIRAIGKVLIYMTEDYFDSFWTATEFLTTLWMLGRDQKTGMTMLDEAYFVKNRDNLNLQSFRDGFIEFAVPKLDQVAMDRFVWLINNGDPITSAPETQVPPSGLAKLVATFTQSRYGYYESEFMTRSFWHVVRVPCPICKPKNRLSSKIDWHQHMTLTDATKTIDYFGYFPVEPHELETGKVKCPNCHTTISLENKRGVRTLWAPIMTTEKDKSRPVIQEHKVWEVVV